MTEYKLDPKVIDGYFDEMAEMEVPLDPDPLLFSPTRLTNKISMTRQHLARTQRIWTELSQRQGILKRELRGADLELELESDHLMAEDPEVAAGPSQGVKEAIVKRKLREMVLRVRDIQDALEDVEIVIKVAASKRTDLKDTQTRIRDQIKLCEEELGLHGRTWGERGPGDVTGDAPPVEGKPHRAEGLSVAKRKSVEREQQRSISETQPETTPGTMPELDDLLEEVEADKAPANEALFPSSTSKEQVNNFLEGDDDVDKPATTLEEDFSDIFT